MNAPLINLYRQAEDYFFRGISSKCLDLDDGAHAYMTEAKKLGARHCFLESSDSGLGVYQKLGFETLFKNNIYSRTARVPAIPAGK